MTVDELRDCIAEAIRGEPVSGERPWSALADERKQLYRDDADRVLMALEAAQAEEVLSRRAEMRADFAEATTWKPCVRTLEWVRQGVECADMIVASAMPAHMERYTKEEIARGAAESAKQAFVQSLRNAIAQTNGTKHPVATQEAKGE